ncbi:hypothetical protein EJ110_NYTH11209, partial [Nymphaea thermarum]
DRTPQAPLFPGRSQNFPTAKLDKSEASPLFTSALQPTFSSLRRRFVRLSPLISLSLSSPSIFFRRSIFFRTRASPASFASPFTTQANILQSSGRGIVLDFVYCPSYVNWVQSLRRHRRLGRKHKFKVEMNKHGQPIGEKAQKLSSFIGKLARNPQVTPLTYHTWKELPQTYKDDIWNRVKEKFEGPGVKVTWVMKEHAKLWRCWRCNLRKLYKKHKALESCMKHCKVTIPEDQWRCLIQHFETTKSKEQSEKNKANRAMLKFPHNTGTKSFARLRAEKVAEGTPEPSRAEVFIMTRTSKKGNCHNQATGEAIAQINEAMSQLPEGIRDDPAPTDILSRVVGPDKYGRVHTYGMGVKPSEFFDASPSRSELMVQNAVLREQLDDLHNKVDQVEANQAEKIRQLEASSKKVNELQVQINLLMDMIKNEEASGN